MQLRHGAVELDVHENLPVLLVVRHGVGVAHIHGSVWMDRAEERADHARLRLLAADVAARRGGFSFGEDDVEKRGQRATTGGRDARRGASRGARRFRRAFEPGRGVAIAWQRRWTRARRVGRSRRAAYLSQMLKTTTGWTFAEATWPTPITGRKATMSAARGVERERPRGSRVF